MPPNQVARLAVQRHNDRNLSKGRYKSQINETDPGIEKVVVNYVRHELTPYDGLVMPRADDLAYKRTRIKIYTIVRERVLAEIAKAYPWLTSECRRQIADGGGRAEMELLDLE